MARRNKLLAEQRTSYLKELIYLKELLYRKTRGEKVEESWGQFFDYGDQDLKRSSSSISLAEDESDASTLQASASQTKATATISQLKRDFATEKRKFKNQLESELKKQENTHKQTLKAKERELTEIKTLLEKKNEEIEQTATKVEEIRKKLEETENLRILQTEQLELQHQKTIGNCYSVFFSLLANILKDQQETTSMSDGIQEELFKGKLAEISWEYQRTINEQVAKIQEQAIVIEELKIRANTLSKASVWSGAARKGLAQNSRSLTLKKAEIEKLLEERTIECNELQKVAETQKDEINSLRKQREELFDRITKVQKNAEELQKVNQSLSQASLANVYSKSLVIALQYFIISLGSSPRSNSVISRTSIKSEE